MFCHDPHSTLVRCRHGLHFCLVSVLYHISVLHPSWSTFHLCPVSIMSCVLLWSTFLSCISLTIQISVLCLSCVSHGPHFCPVFCRGPHFCPVFCRGPHFCPVFCRGPHFCPVFCRGPHFCPVSVTVHISVLCSVGVHISVLCFVGVHISVLCSVGVHISVLCSVGVHISVLCQSRSISQHFVVIVQVSLVCYC